LTTYKDSVSGAYNSKITQLANIANKDKEQTDLEGQYANQQKVE
jgi:hypothetical protein